MAGAVAGAAAGARSSSTVNAREATAWYPAHISPPAVLPSHATPSATTVATVQPVS
ncbi:hypothetical protein GTX14_26425 [Streptomyces sp. SID4944]|nr:hypothetical protein [Streptomyces sp. SID4944]